MGGTFVVDTNVLVTAEGGAGASRGCAAQCQKRLTDIRHNGSVALDSGWLILNEYRANLPGRGQPGLGFRFFQWLLTVRSNPARCSMVRIHAHDARSFEEFPDHEGLKDFDWADRKFVAVAATHPARPVIIQATDSKWVGWRGALEECGIGIDLICKKEIETVYKRKMRRK